MWVPKMYVPCLASVSCVFFFGLAGPQQLALFTLSSPLGALIALGENKIKKWIARMTGTGSKHSWRMHPPLACVLQLPPMPGRGVGASKVDEGLMIDPGQSGRYRVSTLCLWPKVSGLDGSGLLDAGLKSQVGESWHVWETSDLALTASEVVSSAPHRSMYLYSTRR